MLAIAAVPARLAALAVLTLLLTACAGKTQPPLSPAGVPIVRIERGFTNTYLLLGERVAVVDTGTPGHEKRVLRALKRHKRSSKDVSAIVLTHGHADHAGSAAALRTATGARIIAGRDDDPALRRGHNDTMHPTDKPGKRLLPLLRKDYPAFSADTLVATELDLHPLGVPGKILAMPGHTPGSLAVVLDDGQAISGDIIRAKMFARKKPVLHFFHADQPRAHGQLARLLDDFAVMRIHPGHGHALEAAALRAYLAGRSDVGPRPSTLPNTAHNAATGVATTASPDSPSPSPDSPAKIQADVVSPPR